MVIARRYYGCMLTMFPLEEGEGVRLLAYFNDKMPPKRGSDGGRNRSYSRDLMLGEHPMRGLKAAIMDLEGEIGGRFQVGEVMNAVSDMAKCLGDEGLMAFTDVSMIGARKWTLTRTMEC